MRTVRLLASTCVIILAVASTAQQVPAPSSSSAPQTPSTTTGGVQPSPGSASGPRVILKIQKVPSLPVTPPQHPATEAQLREYFSLLNFSRAAHASMSAIIRGERATAAPYYPASLWDDFSDEIAKVDLISLNIPIYQEYFSEEDMNAILAFYHSPAGKKLLDEQPLITSTAEVIIRGRMEEIGKAVYLRHKDEIDAAKKAYTAGHPSSGTN